MYLHADGTLDNTFGSSGVQIHPASTYKNYGMEVELQSDGKIIAVGRIFDGSNADIVVARLNADGSLDNTFSTDGWVVYDFPGGSTVPEAVAIQSDGKIVIGGYSGVNSDDYTLIRLNADGSFDNTFGTAGVVTSEFGTNDSYIEDLAIQADGKIVAGGFIYDSSSFMYKMTAARYNADGTIDSSFGTSGLVTVSAGAGNDFGIAVSIQSDGKILLGGHTWIANSPPALKYDLAVVRLNANGTIDNTYGTSGVAKARIIDAENYLAEMELQPDGKLVLAASTAGLAYDFAAVRFNTDGTMDNSFGSSGIVTTDIYSGEDYGKNIVLQPDGKILMCGYTYTATYSDYVVVRYNGDVTGISEDNDMTLSLRPNPATDFVTIETNESARIEVLDISGKTIFSSVAEGPVNIDVSGFSKGLYFVNVQSGNNSNVSKLIVE